MPFFASEFFCVLFFPPLPGKFSVVNLALAVWRVATALVRETKYFMSSKTENKVCALSPSVSFQPLRERDKCIPLSRLGFYLISTVIAQVPFRGVFCTRDSSGSAAVFKPIFIAAVHSFVPLVPLLQIYSSSINGAGRKKKITCPWR